MFGDILRRGIGMEDLQPLQQPMQLPQGVGMPLGFQNMNFGMSPQKADMYGQFNNPMMFLRRQ